MKQLKSYLITLAIFMLLSFTLAQILSRPFKWWLDIAVVSGLFLGKYLVGARKARRLQKNGEHSRI